VELLKLKKLPKDGVCPSVLAKKQQQEATNQVVLEKSKELSLKDVVGFYLTQHIDDRVVDGVKISAAKNPKGQREVRRQFTKDLYPALAAQ